MMIPIKAVATFMAIETFEIMIISSDIYGKVLALNL
jgi:hypothetical protein